MHLFHCNFIAKYFTSLVALFAMLSVTLTQVSAVGFCEKTMEVFFGQHEVGTGSVCSHDLKDHSSTKDCGNESEPCEGSHSEIDVDVDDFLRTSSENENSSPEALSTAQIQLAPRKNFYPQTYISKLDFARPPPELPVFLRFGVMRL